MGLLQAALRRPRAWAHRRTRVRAKHALLVAAAWRTVTALVALPLVPVLYPKLFLLLVFLRPSLGVLLAGAILAREGGISLPAMLAVAVPLQLLWVWLYFLLGQAWQSEIDSDDKLPFITARLLQPRQVRRLRRLVRARGARFVVMARFAIFPTGLLAATAGASDLPPRKFFPADGAALLAACGLVVGAGYGLGLAEHQSDIWLTVAGVAGLVALSGALTWYLRHGDPGQQEGSAHECGADGGVATGSDAGTREEETTAVADAITILRDDHKEIRRLFREFQAAGEAATKTKGKLVERIIELLTVHTYLENEVMYPCVQELLPDLAGDIAESFEEHHVADVLCTELAAMKPDSERFDAKTTVLIENVTHHIEEEEGDWFPKVRAGLGRNQLQEIGARIEEARQKAPKSPARPGAIKKAIDALTS